MLLTNVIFFFAGNRVAADLPVLNSCQVPKEVEHEKGFYMVWHFISG